VWGGGVWGGNWYIIALALPFSFVTKNTLAGFENSGIWPFSRSAFHVEDFEVVSVLYGGSNERCVLTALSVSMTSSSVAQVDSSLKNKLTAQQVSLYPRAASSVGRSGSQLKGRLRILTPTPDKECRRASQMKTLNMFYLVIY